jgi:acetylornithine deacetylase/succinyl-diaminopimelate desuccinylase-like protein
LPEDATRYSSIIGTDTAAAAVADDYFLDREPRHASMLRTSVSPTIIQGGYRINVIPSEAKANLDVRTLPDEDLNAFLAQLTKVIDDPAVEVAWAAREVSPPSGRHHCAADGWGS